MKLLSPISISIVIIFFLGIAIDGVVIQPLFHHRTNPNILTVRQDGYTYIAPLLRCDNQTPQNSQAIQQLNQNLDKYITGSINTNTAEQISVYYRDLQSSEWFSVNGEVQYAPASLLKVPIMMGILKNTQSNPGILSRHITFEGGDDNYKQQYPPTQKLAEGNSYTMDDLLKSMVVYSDNTAKNILISNLDSEAQKRVFQELKVDISNEQDDSITVADYSVFFRTLYSATYLGPELSEKALSLLTQTNFTQGIQAGVPAGVQVAHKFGERSDETSTNKQLHECGIVYHPDRPYILCVMTKGNSFEKLQSVIQQISADTYTGIEHWRH